MNRLAQVLLAVAFATFVFQGPARAQSMGGGDMMTMMAPMMEMMKKKMGKRQYAQIMRTMGPMMVGMMNNGGGMGGMGGNLAGLGGNMAGNYGGMGSGYGGLNGGGYGVMPAELNSPGYGGGIPVNAGGFDAGQLSSMGGGMGNMGGMEQLMSNSTIQHLIGMAGSGRGGHRSKRHRTDG